MPESLQCPLSYSLSPQLRTQPATPSSWKHSLLLASETSQDLFSLYNSSHSFCHQRLLFLLTNSKWQSCSGLHAGFYCLSFGDLIRSLASNDVLKTPTVISAAHIFPAFLPHISSGPRDISNLSGVLNIKC